jgi:hypothetical protein
VLKRVKKKHRGAHLQDQACTFNVGDLVVKGPGINYRKRKKASSKLITQTSVKKLIIQRIAFKVPITPFAIKEC